MKFSHYAQKAKKHKPKANRAKAPPADLIAEVKPDGWTHKVQLIRNGERIAVRHGKYDYPATPAFYAQLTKSEARQLRKALYVQGVRGNLAFGFAA